jgi:hypothetical protein
MEAGPVGERHSPSKMSLRSLPDRKPGLARLIRWRAIPHVSLSSLLKNLIAPTFDSNGLESKLGFKPAPHAERAERAERAGH